MHCCQAPASCPPRCVPPTVWCACGQLQGGHTASIWLWILTVAGCRKFTQCYASAYDGAHRLNCCVQPLSYLPQCSHDGRVWLSYRSHAVVLGKQLAGPLDLPNGSIPWRPKLGHHDHQRGNGVEWCGSQLRQTGTHHRSVSDSSCLPPLIQHHGYDELCLSGAEDHIRGKKRPPATPEPACPAA